MKKIVQVIVKIFVFLDKLGCNNLTCCYLYIYINTYSCKQLIIVNVSKLITNVSQTAVGGDTDKAEHDCK